MHAIGKTSQKNFDKEHHSGKEREEYYDRVNQPHEFADMTEDTICGFGEKDKVKKQKRRCLKGKTIMYEKEWYTCRCPYCGSSNPIELETTAAGLKWIKCDECRKNFKVSV